MWRLCNWRACSRWRSVLSPSVGFASYSTSFCWTSISCCRAVWKMSPNCCLLHCLKHAFRRFSLKAKRYMPYPCAGNSQVFYTIDRKPGFEIQKVWNLKGFGTLALVDRKLTRSGEWSDVARLRCWTEVFDKKLSHWWLANTLSSRFQILAPALIPDHV